MCGRTDIYSAFVVLRNHLDTRLTIDLLEHSDDATITVTLPADDLPAIAHAAENLPAEHPTHGADQREPADPLFVDAVVPPGEARTASTNTFARLELVISSRVCVSAPSASTCELISAWWGRKSVGRVAHKPPTDAAARCEIVGRVRLCGHRIGPTNGKAV